MTGRQLQGARLQLFNRQAPEQVDRAGEALGSFLAGFVREVPFADVAAARDQRASARGARAAAGRPPWHVGHESNHAALVDAGEDGERIQAASLMRARGKNARMSASSAFGWAAR